MDTAWFDKLAALVEAERDHERAQAQALLAREGVAALEERGLALGGLSAREESALAGRVLVIYVRAEGGELGASRIGVGAIVRVVPARPSRGENERAVEGIVARRTRTTLGVAFDEAPPIWATENKVTLTLVPSDATWTRVLGAIDRLRAPATPNEKRARALVLGERPPRADFEPLDANGGPPAAGLGGSASPTALNAEQAAAAAQALRGELVLVHGPPGTGKTRVLAEVVRRAANAGRRVLCTAASNAAVDLLVERIAALGLRVTRLGHPARLQPAMLEHALEVQAREREAARMARLCVEEALKLCAEADRAQRRRGPGRFSESREARREAGRLFAEARRLEKAAELDALDRAQVVAATLTSLTDDRLTHLTFDLVVVDEATQALEPALYLALPLAPRVVLAGDHLQLPPTVLSAAAQKGGLGVSLFERFVALYPNTVRALTVQYRMHEAIMRFPGESLYGGALVADASVARHTLAELAPGVDPAPVEFFDTAGAGHSEEQPEGSESYRNPGEAEMVAREARALLARGLDPARLAVIAPYEAQVQLLRQMLPGEPLEIDTVDAFQGREKEAIVVSLVRSNATGEVGFLADVRRMNVAVTRARRKLIVVGDSSTVSAHPFYKAFVEHVERHGRWRSVWE